MFTEHSESIRAIFRSLQRYLIWFKSGLWLGHSSTFTELSQSRSCVVLSVCLGPLSGWKVNLRQSLRSRALWTWFSSGISPYFGLFSFPSTLTSLPVPAAEKHPHSMMLPPPGFTVGMVLGRWWAVPCFLQTWHLELRPNNSILVSSDQIILFLTVWESFRCVLPSRLSCVFHCWEGSVWPLWHKAQIGGVLQGWLSFWKFLHLHTQSLELNQSENQVLGYLS